MVTFNLSSTVEAKNLMRSSNPERMDLIELRVLEKKVISLLNDLWKLSSERNFISQHEKINVFLRRNELDSFLARIKDLIQAALSIEGYLDAAGSDEEINPTFNGFKI